MCGYLPMTGLGIYFYSLLWFAILLVVAVVVAIVVKIMFEK